MLGLIVEVGFIFREMGQVQDSYLPGFPDGPMDLCPIMCSSTLGPQSFII